ncbi:DNA mismatch repair protein MutS [mine drainage metagenome]|uniref:DNA mismatch repair protein MutS n=1 Tax=mine drainage metagenome TaxID=410659 RepID=A0A1J5T897_9ZZZZ
MHADKTTLHDLSIFHHDEEQSVFHHLNFTQTNGGREHLRSILHKPLESIHAIKDVQQTLKQLMAIADSWAYNITNGTVMVVEKFYDTPLEPFPHGSSFLESWYYKIMNGPDYSLTKYSVEHFIAFFKGLEQISTLLSQPKSVLLQTSLERINMLLKHPNIQEMTRSEKGKELSPVDVMTFGRFLKNHFDQKTSELIDIYSKLDAYLSLAIACKKYNFNFPDFEETNLPFFEAENLFHVQLTMPVAYNVCLNNEKNFLFLTGANMGGKSTFIKAMGIGVYLAHLGMGVPATKMRLSFFDGILSNIQVVDNVVKGESFFYNEVQRIKSTVEKISDGKKWLILIDELFKGTNQQDAVKCSITVIEGLRKMNNALFVLSTHLYEIGEALKQYKNIQFQYFETSIVDDQLVFSYQLKEGISNDRLGYLILKKEGVVDMLNKL